MSGNLVLYHGRVYTLDPAQPRASALVAHNGHIIYVGDDTTALRWPSARVDGERLGEIIDLDGATVIPGLADAHLHLGWFALSLLHVNVETPTLEAALERVAERAADTPTGTWIIGAGWNHNIWGDAWPTAHLLDRIAPHHPIALQAKSGHASWVNSRALALAGITAETPDPPGGRIVRDVEGRPSGVLLENAMNLVAGVIPDPTLDDMINALRLALPIAHRAGLTAVHDFDGPLTFAAQQVLHQRGELTLRILKSIPLDQLDNAIALGLRSGFGDDWLRIGQVKMFADGALGTRTAWMLPGNDIAASKAGSATTDLETLWHAIQKATTHGLACAIHAIGDQANREVLNLYTRLGTRPSGLRQRIEHVQLLHPDDAGRLAKLGIIASMQPIHATSDMDMAERYWGPRTRNAHVAAGGAYALKTQIYHGAVLALGSDCPVEKIDPLAGIHAAVTRRRADGSPGPEGWHPEQRLTIEEAIRGFSWGPAYAAGMEHRLGSLQTGKLADMTILDHDLFTIDPMEILHIRVLGTVVGGQLVWRDTPSSPSSL